ncbi:MAG: lasso RiPP family leader peptide-containing protein [Solirubrobacteraceae bacterium]|jgi:hypothetical protein
MPDAKDLPATDVRGSRLPYHTPSLTSLGTVTELTAGAGQNGSFDGTGYAPTS